MAERLAKRDKTGFLAARMGRGVAVMSEAVEVVGALPVERQVIVTVPVRVPQILTVERRDAQSN